MRELTIGIDIGGTNTKYGIVDIPEWELDLYEQKSGTSSSNP